MQVIILVVEDLYSESDEVVVQWEELETQIQAKFARNLFGTKDKDD